MIEEKVRFYDKEHRYYIGERELISVSAITKLFFPDKDWKSIATKYAKKNGGKAADWQEKWRLKGQLATEAGTILHKQREDELLEKDVEFKGVKYNKVECEVIDGVKYAVDISKLEYKTVYPELMIYDLEYGVSGQADKVIITDTHIHIADYKTDQEIKFKGYSSQWKKVDKMKEPLQHLDDCNGNHYSLKMSMYMYLVWRKNKHLKPGRLILEHITLQRDEEGIPVLVDGFPVVLKEELIDLPYRKMEVIDMLKHYKEKQNG